MKDSKKKGTDSLFMDLAPWWKVDVIEHGYMPFANLHPETESIEPHHTHYGPRRISKWRPKYFSGKENQFEEPLMWFKAEEPTKRLRYLIVFENNLTIFGGLLHRQVWVLRVD